LGKDTFEIRFDRRGHVVIEDAELQRRLLYLLQHDGELVLRLRSGERPNPVGFPEPTPPIPKPEPMPIPQPRNGTWCPNMMCGCQPLKIVDDRLFEQQWDSLRTDPGNRPQP